MALPKRQHSKKRSRTRRSNNWKVSIPSLSSCPNCKKQIIPHRVCPFCGHYKGTAIEEIQPKAEKKKK